MCMLSVFAEGVEWGERKMGVFAARFGRGRGRGLRGIGENV
jgi:hypothetical protein